MFTKQILKRASRLAAVLLIGTAGLLRGLAHDADGVVQIGRAVPREVGEDLRVVRAQVRRCLPEALSDDDGGLRAARCYAATVDAEKSRAKVVAPLPR